jgi:glycyl-radical enzyme activating protein
MECAKACLSEALQVAGRSYTIDELMKILLRDQSYWGDQGGVTFSGGEPLLQEDFLLEVLRKCRSHYIHTAVETCAHIDEETIVRILPWIDWLIIDIKHMNTAVHRKHTGTGNELILNNVQAIASSDWDGRLIIRVPIVPDCNDDIENLEATAAFVRGLHLKEVNLLPFHRLGSTKYEQLGLIHRCSEVVPPSTEEMIACRRIFTSAGLHCYIDSETPF